MKIFLCTTDRSGDFHGALLAAALKREQPDVDLCGVGGELMAGAGVRILLNPVSRAVVGFFEVLKSLPAWRQYLEQARQAAVREKPAKIILIDSPSFNLRLARKLRNQPADFIYYISPQVWAWGSGRVKEIGDFCRKVLVIFPFEEPIYRQAGVPVRFVGHPFLDTVRPQSSREEIGRTFGLKPDRPILLLLPGSRRSEVRALFPVMAEVAGQLNARRDIQIMVYSAGPEITPLLRTKEHIRIISGGDKYGLMAAADMALAASGSVTLELTLLATPFLLLYRLSGASYVLLKKMIKIPFAGITNILAGKEIVPEFIQTRCRPEIIFPAALNLLENAAQRQRMREQLGAVRHLLGEPGATRRAAQEILGD